MIRVRGELRSAATGDLVSGCTRELLGPSGEPWESARSLDARFRISFTVAPTDAVYTLVITCPGFAAHSVRVARSRRDGRVLEQDLGAIMLAPVAR